MRHHYRGARAATAGGGGGSQHFLQNNPAHSTFRFVQTSPFSSLDIVICRLYGPFVPVNDLSPIRHHHPPTQKKFLAK